MTLLHSPLLLTMTWLEDTLLAAFSPGIGPWYLRVLYSVLSVLHLLLLGLIVAGIGNIHTWVMLGLSIGLHLSIRHLMSVIAQLPDSSNQSSSPGPQPAHVLDNDSAHHKHA